MTRVSLAIVIPKILPFVTARRTEPLGPIWLVPGSASNLLQSLLVRRRAETTFGLLEVVSIVVFVLLLKTTTAL